MSVSYVLHILAVGIWLGCLATTIAFEKHMAADETSRPLVSELRDLVDRWIEGPAFAITFLTGFALATNATWTGLLTAKFILGGAAIALNVWHRKIVSDRAAAAREGRRQDWVHIDRLLHRVGWLVAFFLVAATALALVRVG